MILTVKEAAEQLSISPQRVRVLLAQKRLKGKKLGHDWVVQSLKYSKMKRGRKHQKTLDELINELVERTSRSADFKRFVKYTSKYRYKK